MKILLKRVYLLCDLELNCNEGSANFLFLASIFLLLFLELEVTVENCLTKIFLLSDSSDHQQALSILVFQLFVERFLSCDYSRDAQRNKNTEGLSDDHKNMMGLEVSSWCCRGFSAIFPLYDRFYARKTRWNLKKTP